jgi:hypothetical protein
MANGGKCNYQEGSQLNEAVEFILDHQDQLLLVTNVAFICQLTWMCAPPPEGPNIHANESGYGVIAQEFLDVFDMITAAP